MKREEDLNIIPDPDVDAYMKVCRLIAFAFVFDILHTYSRQIEMREIAQ